MNLSDLVRSECDRYRAECNFTPSERAVFDLRVADESIVCISMKLNMSESAVNARIRKIKQKIDRISTEKA